MFGDTCHGNCINEVNTRLVCYENVKKVDVSKQQITKRESEIEAVCDRTLKKTVEVFFLQDRSYIIYLFF